MSSVVAIGFVVVFATIALSLLRLGLHLAADDHPLAQVRGRLVVSVAVFLIALALAMAADSVWSGVAYTVATPLAAAAALLAFGAVPWREPDRGSVRSASLHRRRWVDRTMVIDVLAPLVALGVTAGVVIACIPFSAADGRSFTVTTGDGLMTSSSTAGEFPGHWFGPLILLGLATLTGAGLVALRRTALLPAAHPDDAVDARWRRRAARTVLAITSTGVLFETAMVTYSVGNALGIAVDQAGASHLVRVLDTIVHIAAPASLLAALAALGTSLVLAVLVGTGSAEQPEPAERTA